MVDVAPLGTIGAKEGTRIDALVFEILLIDATRTLPAVADAGVTAVLAVVLYVVWQAGMEKVATGVVTPFSQLAAAVDVAVIVLVPVLGPAVELSVNGAMAAWAGRAVAATTRVVIAAVASPARSKRRRGVEWDLLMRGPPTVISDRVGWVWVGPRVRTIVGPSREGA
ncbi:hypothetical protein Ahu01nite_035440 [Winogradskya humida]|uniref:Uncharacterized protein n=1 Tax=Winogradskya humida TaxID=113566 RepID=A0ABQ3ZPG8_9ACTN|nr:hypothetical protein Ahu01nite_035440 [Actinoplanes humidus]